MNCLWGKPNSSSVVGATTKVKICQTNVLLIKFYIILIII